ncbi:MAG: ParB/RepB/Spo0J family partition protein [Clostridiales bacterium]|jgi:ParB family chromosome partitioning protein|nr:ParB/RepB/Spo0J family partition protein [Clostridiales bacterium]
MAIKKSGLGKGLDLIFAENDTEDPNSVVVLKISEIEPNRDQPRKEFDEEAMAELADSIAQHGILQPLLVRPIFGGGYQIVAGERRWRAARMAGVSEAPVVVRELTDGQVMELALIENLQREDLTPLEEALGYQTLIETYGMTQDEVSKTVGKSRPSVTNALRLLHLPEEVRELLEEKKISAGHARALLSLPDEGLMMELAHLAADQEISVRELERLVKKIHQEQKKESKSTQNKARIPYFQEVELALHDHLGRKVHVNGTEKKGTLQIEFYGEDDLSELIRLLNLNQ